MSMDGSGLQHTSMEIRKQLSPDEMVFFKMLADNPDDLSLIPRSQIPEWKERTDFWKSSRDFHLRAVESTPTSQYLHT